MSSVRDRDLMIAQEADFRNRGVVDLSFNWQLISKNAVLQPFSAFSDQLAVELKESLLIYDTGIEELTLVLYNLILAHPCHGEPAMAASPQGGEKQ